MSYDRFNNNDDPSSSNRQIVETRLSIEPSSPNGSTTSNCDVKQQGEDMEGAHKLNTQALRQQPIE